MKNPIVKLGDVCQLKGGGTPSKSNDSFYQGNIPWATVRDMNQDLLQKTSFTISEDAVNSSATNVIEKGNIIIATRVGLGKVCVLQQNTAINQDLKAVIPNDENELSKDYLFWWLKFIAPVIIDAGTGATVQGVKIPFIKNLELFLLPIKEQKYIVTILNQTFANIEKARINAEQNLKNTRELFESYLQQVFNQYRSRGVATKLGDIAEISSGGTPRKSNHEFWNGDIAWYSSGELNDLYTVHPKLKITNVGLQGSNAKLFPKGALLIGMYDTAALKMSILDREGAFNQAIAGVKPNQNLNLEFILHAVNFIKPELLKLRRGVRQKNLSQSKIKNIPIFLPSLKLQNEVVTMLHQMKMKTNRLDEIYMEKLNALDELKKSILQKAFTGELTKAK